MTFTKQDAVTFLIGLGVAVFMVVGQSLAASDNIAEDPVKWLISLGTAVLTAAGRYIVTELTQRGLTGRD